MTKPTIEELQSEFEKKLDFFTSQGMAEKFLSHYESNGWMVGRTKMKSWKHAVQTWILNQTKYDQRTPKNSQPGTSHNRIEALSKW